jgi:hypothetical protein
MVISSITETNDLVRALLPFSAAVRDAITEWSDDSATPLKIEQMKHSARRPHMEETSDATTSPILVV